MSFSNATPFSALDVPTIDPSGCEVVVAIVKATFVVDEQSRVTLADVQVPVRVSDVLHDEANPASSVRYPSDVCTAKRGTDVVLVAEAVSAKPVTSMDVAVKARDVTAPLRVHGERRYFRHVMQIAVSDAVPFERQPIVYEKAYGGAALDQSLVEARNPSGVGVAKREADLIDQPAPQIEHPGFPYRSPRDHHPPVGFGAIAPHWSPRREHAGTFDDRWRATRMPLMPRDFDLRHNSVAHPSLFLEQPLREGDPIGTIGTTLRGFFGFAIPRFSIILRARFDRGAPAEARPAIDTILIEPGPSRFEIIVRKAFPLGRGQQVLRSITADYDA